MASKKEQAEAWERIADSIKACGPDGSATLMFESVGSRPSSSGRTEYIDVHVLRIGDDGRPAPSEWLAFNIALAFGYRFNRNHEAIAMGGYGYCRATQIVGDLARKAGHAIRVESHGFAFGPRGWHPKAPVKS
jgi:hypothetical protein